MRAGLLVLVSTIVAAGAAGAAAQVAAPSGAAAAAPADTVASSEVALTLDEAVARAMKVAPTLEALHANAEAASAARRAAESDRLPRLALSAGYTRYSHVPEFAVPVSGGPPRVLFPDIPDYYRGRAELGSSLFTFGRIGATIAAAREEEHAASEDRRAGLAETVLQTRSAYWDLLVARERRRVLDEALASFDAHSRDAANRERVGLAARNEVLAIEVERDRAELARIEADRAAAVAEASLRTWLDYPPGTAIRPTEPVEPLSPSDTSTVGKGEGAAAPEAAAPATDELVRRRPENRALAARERAMTDRARAASRGQLPALSFAAGYDMARPNRRITPPEDTWKDTWDVSVNLSWSLFDGGRARAEARRARAQAAALAGSRRELARGIEIEITSARLELETARRSLAVTDRALASARENLKVAGDRYREGMIPSSERLDAESALLQVGLDRTEALARIELARARWERATAGAGGPDGHAGAGATGGER